MKLYEQGLENYSKTAVFLSNLAMIIWIALGTLACWFLAPLAAWIYLAIALILVGVVLRKLVCTNCYYYNKWCDMGWGKLAALMFKEGEMEKFSTSIGIRLAPFVYGLLTVVPAVLVIISLVREFTILKIIVLACLILITIYSGFINRRKGCASCKMKLVCPGSVS